MATKSNEEIQADAPFEINDYHKKALVVLLRCHFENIEISYLDLSSEMKAAEKTKAWQCVAWKELRSNEYVVHGSEKKMWKLSDGKGVELAKTFADDEMLADFKTPLTNEEHHAKIKSKLSKVEKASKLGPKIFDYFIEQNRPMTKDEVAAHFKTVPDAHHFFYGFQAVKKRGYIEKSGMASKDYKNYDFTDGKAKKKCRLLGGQLWKLSDSAFLGAKKPAPCAKDE